MRYFRFMMPVKTTALCLALLTCNAVSNAIAADKLVALYSSHAVPYSMPWIAEDSAYSRSTTSISVSSIFPLLQPQLRRFWATMSRSVFSAESGSSMPTRTGPRTSASSAASKTS